MTMPHALLVARLKAIGTTAGVKVFPLIAPQGTGYPCIVYQVIGNDNEVVSHGGIPDFQMRVRVTCLALSRGGEAGYTNAWTLAEAVIGDCSATPSGMVGWVDANGQQWNLESCFDEVGEIVSGRETFEAFVVNQVYSVFYQVGV